jgi:hypothetical protein
MTSVSLENSNTSLGSSRQGRLPGSGCPRSSGLGREGAGALDGRVSPPEEEPFHVARTKLIIKKKETSKLQSGLTKQLFYALNLQYIVAGSKPALEEKIV